MTTTSFKFEISNPSDQFRSDYVQIDLDKLGLPSDVDLDNLKLTRIDINKDNNEAINYQIDTIFGKLNAPRILIFYAKDVLPSGSDNYQAPSAQYELSFGESFVDKNSTDLWIGHYYIESKGDEPSDGFSSTWDPDRPQKGISLNNAAIEIQFSLSSTHPFNKVTFPGAATSVTLTSAKNHGGGGGECCHRSILEMIPENGGDKLLV